MVVKRKEERNYQEDINLSKVADNQKFWKRKKSFF